MRLRSVVPSLIGFAAYCSVIVQPVAAEEAVKPNILLIVTDDQGYNDAGFQGSVDIETPNLDRLAEQGVVFTDAHVSATVCSPSRAGLMTGRYQQRFGHEANVPPPNFGMDVEEVTIADVLREHGYKTAVFGKWHLGEKDQYHPNNRGFDYFHGFLGGSRSYFPADLPPGHAQAMMKNREHAPITEGYLTDIQGDGVVRFLEELNEDPFFIFLSFLAPHTPMEATEEDLARFEGHPRQVFAAMMWAMDRAVGDVVGKLEEQGKLENTLIFFLSDNGGSYFNDSSNEPLKGWKGNKYEGGHRVPFFVSWTGGINGGRTFDGLASALDIFATSMAAAGVEETPGRPLDGVNLLPFLTGEKDGEPHQKLFFRKEEGAAMRDGNWKLIRLQDYGYVMYDLGDDPGESRDLSEENREQFLSMKSDLEAWEEGLAEPWWEESRAWQDVTRGIHKALMNNEEPDRVRP